jgi:RNA polymerase sigma factor (sigma-70 family)
MPIPVPAELVAAAQHGDSIQVERLVQTIWPDAYRLANAILGDRQGAEDAAQEACIIVYRTIASLRSAAAFRVWFYRIVVREASELKRRRSRNEPAAPAEPERADHAAAIDIWRALATLPHDLREAVVLRYFEDLSSREIAAVLRVPAGTVRFRLMIARRRLRPLLSDGSELTTHAAEVRTNAI